MKRFHLGKIQAIGSYTFYHLPIAELFNFWYMTIKISVPSNQIIGVKCREYNSI